MIALGQATDAGLWNRTRVELGMRRRRGLADDLSGDHGWSPPPEGLLSWRKVKADDDDCARLQGSEINTAVPTGRAPTSKTSRSP